MIRILSLPLCLVAFAAYAEEMKPGRWEITSQMKIPGMQMPAVTMTFCYTEKDIREGRHFRPDPAHDCKISNLKQGGNAISFDMTCKHDGRITTMSTKGTITATTFQFEQKMRAAEMGEMTTLSQGKRIGDCK